MSELAKVQPSLVFPDADIILRSNDLMTFHVNKAVLREASQYFRSIFAIAGPNSGENQVLGIEMPGWALLILLQSQSLYHFTLSEPRPAVDALEFDLAESQLKNGPLVTALAAEPNPLRAWAIAKAYQLPEAADAALCRYFLSSDDFKAQWHSVPELAKINAMEFNALIHRRERGIAALKTHALNILWGGHCGECDTRIENEAYPDSEKLEGIEPHIGGRSRWVVASLLRGAHPAALGKDWILVVFSLVDLKITCNECKRNPRAVRHRGRQEP
ncbi:hypothetical protein DL93DRAFT_2165732 [Clavulina sp. PMI_390]|nr:hypothetical protein DL93DRAFT_2165732 [Clavulina sp. PMI_390]